MERDFGSLRIFIIYTLCGIAGFMFGAEYSIQTPSVGCSGSLYGKNIYLYIFNYKYINFIFYFHFLFLLIIKKFLLYW